jgi:uncharacterized protein (TIGR02594 family)
MTTELLVTASKLHLRKTATIGDNIVGVLERGEIVRLLELTQDGLWCRVQRPNQKQGWVAKKYVCEPSLYPVELQAIETYPWMPIAIAQIGVSEVDGPGSNPRIQEFLHSCELGWSEGMGDEAPWCSGAVNWCLEMAGYAGTNSLLARSWLHWGEPLVRPQRGCITVLSRGPVDGSRGHVGFYLEKVAGKLALLGGNQGNRFGLGHYAEGRLLGYRVAARKGGPAKKR